MPAANVRLVVRHLAADPPTDSELVTAFAARRDQAAFAELVRRHGPTVFGVCRRVLGEPHAAEDAFQAVFLVLARRAGTLRPPGSVGGWLHGVAVRTANKARVAATRRRRREMIAATTRADPEPANPDREGGGGLEAAELRAVLDAELARLPESLRAAVVLCDLHGRTRAEAAAELGCPEGTVATRVHRARKKLADALTRRGLALPAGGIAAVLVPVPVSAALTHSAAAAACGAAAPAVAALAREVIRSMSTTPYTVAVAVAALVAGGLLAGNTLSPAAPEQPAAAAPATIPAAPEQPAAPPKQPAGPWREARVLEQVGWLAGSVAYSPDGKALYVGGTGGHVRAYEAATGKQMWDYRRGDHFAGVAVSPDGKLVASTNRFGAQAIEAASGRLWLNNPGLDRLRPLAVAWFPDTVPAPKGGGNAAQPTHKLIYGGARGYVVQTWQEWPFTSEIELNTAAAGKNPADEYAVPLAVSPDGKRVVVTGPIDKDTGKNVLWAWAAGSGAGNEVLKGHKAAVTSAAWSRDGKVILTGDAGGVVMVWDATTFKEKTRLAIGGRVAAVAVSADGRSVAAAVVFMLEGLKGREVYSEEVFVWDAANPPERPKAISRPTAGGPFQGVASLAFSPDGKSLASAFCNFTHLSRTGELVGKVRVFTTAAERTAPAAPPEGWKEPVVLTHHAGPVDSVAFAPDGQSFVTGGADGRVLIWDGATLKPQELGAVVPAGKFTAVAFSPDGKLVAATRDKVTGFFDPQQRQPVQMRPVVPGARAVAFSPDGKWVAVRGGDLGAIRPLPPEVGNDIPFGSSVAEQERPTPPIAWSPDGKRLAAAVQRRGSGVWDFQFVTPADGKTETRLLSDRPDAVTALAWSKAGKLLATAAEDGRLVLWGGESFKELRWGRFVGHNGGPTRFHSLAFAPDGKTLAAAVTFGSGKSADRILVIATGDLDKLENLFPPSTARTLAFSPDGKRLAAACGIDREKLTPLMTPDEMKAAGAVVVWERKP